MTELLESLGSKLSETENLFLNKMVWHNGLPLEDKYSEHKPEVIATMEEARRINSDSNVKRYVSFYEASKDWDL